MRSLFLTVVFLLCASTVWALRISRPIILSFPPTQDEVKQLNRNLEDLWNIQNGRFELDIVTTTKSNVRIGEIWILNNAGTYSLQFKAGDSVRTLTP